MKEYLYTLYPDSHIGSILPHLLCHFIIRVCGGVGVCVHGFNISGSYHKKLVAMTASREGTE